MRMKTICAVGIISGLNILVSVLTKDIVYFAFLSIGVTALGVYCLVSWIIQPIKEMETQLKRIEKENANIENMRREFVANVSHELNTPLTSIAGFIETLQSGAVGDTVTRNKFIEIIAIETARLKRLIKDILILSDIESQIEVSNKKFNPSEVIKDTIFFLNPIIVSKEVYIDIQLDENISLVGNEDRFKQMVVNLVENAIKYSNKGGKIELKSRENEEYITFEVIDNGIGIAKEDLNRISERFYRVDKSRSKKVGGTGLGLSIVKHTAALFNGELSVTSKLGQGSTFSIIINK